MAAANYRLCDKCQAKTFYDSDVDYEDSNLGAMTALCKDCAQVYEITIAKRGGVAELRAALVDCEEAISSLPEDALGRHPREGWPYRDKLLSNVRAALAATGGQP